MSFYVLNYILDVHISPKKAVEPELVPSLSCNIYFKKTVLGGLPLILHETHKMLQFLFAPEE